MMDVTADGPHNEHVPAKYNYQDEVDDSAIVDDEEDANVSVETSNGNGANNAGQEFEILQALRQLRHDYELLLREKRELEDYCEEVERDSAHKQSLLKNVKLDLEAQSKHQKRIEEAHTQEIQLLNDKLALEEDQHRRALHLARQDSGVGGSLASLWDSRSTVQDLATEAIRLDKVLSTVVGLLKEHRESGDIRAAEVLDDIQDRADDQGTSVGGEQDPENAVSDATSTVRVSRRELERDLDSSLEELDVMRRELDGTREQSEQWESLTNALEIELQSTQELLSREQLERQRLQDQVDELIGQLTASEAREQAHASREASRIERDSKSPEQPSDNDTRQNSTDSRGTEASGFIGDSGVFAITDSANVSLAAELAEDSQPAQTLSLASELENNMDPIGETMTSSGTADPINDSSSIVVEKKKSKKKKKTKRTSLAVPANLMDVIYHDTPEKASIDVSLTESPGSPMGRSTPARSVDDNKIGRSATALYSFKAEDVERELTISKGDSFVVLHGMANEEWWYIRDTKGQTGLVPQKYIHEAGEHDETTKVIKKVSTMHPHTKPQSSLLLETGTSDFARGNGQTWLARFSYKARNDKELSMMKGDEIRILECPPGKSWWNAEDMSGNKGFVPVNYLRKPKSETHLAVAKAKNAESVLEKPPSTRQTEEEKVVGLQKQATVEVAESGGINYDIKEPVASDVVKPAEKRLSLLGRTASLYNKLPSKDKMWETVEKTKERIREKRLMGTPVTSNCDSNSESNSGFGASNSVGTSATAVLPQVNGATNVSSNVSSWFRTKLASSTTSPGRSKFSMFQRNVTPSSEQGKIENDIPSMSKDNLDEGNENWMAMAMQKAQRRREMPASNGDKNSALSYPSVASHVAS